MRSTPSDYSTAPVPWLPARTVVLGDRQGTGSAFAETIDRFTRPVVVEQLSGPASASDPDLVVVEEGFLAGHWTVQVKRLRRAFGDVPLVLLVEDLPASVRDHVVAGLDAVVPAHASPERACRAFAGVMARAACLRRLEADPTDDDLAALARDDEFSEAVGFVEECGEFSLLCYQLFDRPVPGGSATLD